MNWKKGFKRITLLISILVALGVGIFLSVCHWQDLTFQNRRHENCQEIVAFWEIWEKGGWDKKAIIKELSPPPTPSLEHPIYCKINGKMVWLYAREIFPDIDHTYPDLPLYVIEAKAKVAMKQAKEHLESCPYIPIPLLALYVILAGLASGAGSFIAIWIAYYILFYFFKWPVFHLLHWLVLGFREDKPANEQKQ